MIGNIFQGMSGYTCSLNARNSVEFAYNLTAEPGAERRTTGWLAGSPRTS